MTYAGCIVKNQQSGDATDVLKNMFQSFTDTFRRFTSENLFITVIAVREGDDQIFQPFFIPFVNEISFAEIDLGTSRLPDEFQVSPFFFPLFHLLDVALDHIIRARKTFLFHKQPAEFPMHGMESHWGRTNCPDAYLYSEWRESGSLCAETIHGS